MKKFFLCCVLLTATLFITSCKDDNDDPIPTGGSYFTGNTGSTWIYSNYMLQSSSEEKLEKNDTLIQEANKIVLGKNATMMKHHFVNPFTKTSTTANYAIYEDVNDNKLFVNSDFLKIFLPELLQTAWNIAFDDSKWFLLADGNTAEEWIVESFDISNVPMPGYDDVTLNGHLNLGIKRGKDTTIAAANVKANTYTMTAFFEGNILGLNIGVDISNFTIRANFISTSFYLAPQKGLLGIYSPFSNAIMITTEDPILKGLLTMAGYPNGYPFPIDFDSLAGFSLGGFDKRLININVK